MKRFLRLLTPVISTMMATATLTAAEPLTISIENGPKLSIYSPEKPNGAAVMICPGGGYSHKCLDKEGYLFAPFFNDKGITLAVLDYRLPDGNPEIPTGDAIAGMRYLHDNAATLQLDKDKIGVMGCSAGGHLAAMTAVGAPVDVAPKFQILLYPVVSMEDYNLAHHGSVNNLLGEKAGDRKVLLCHSPNLLVTPKTCQAFIVLTSDDNIVNSDNSLTYARALIDNGIACELHMFAHGSHGFGTLDVPFRKLWLSALSEWLDANILTE